MATKKATKAAMDVKEAAVDIRHDDLEASENVKKSSKGHCRTWTAWWTWTTWWAWCHGPQWAKKILKKDSYFQEFKH